jgi:hypothetical protein
VSDEPIYPPIPPSYVGREGEVLYANKGNELEGEWRWSSFWGWSNFIAKNPEKFRSAVVGSDMRVSGVVAEIPSWGLARGESVWEMSEASAREAASDEMVLVRKIDGVWVDWTGCGS